MPFSIVEFGRCLKTSLIVGLFSNLKLLYFVCIAELLLNFVFLILISYAGTHRGWWKEINGVLAVGVITSILTFPVKIHTIVSHHRGKPFAGNSKVFTSVRFVETITCVLWMVSAHLMLLHKRGCDPRGAIDGSDTCKKDTSAGFAWSNQPLITWNIAMALSFFENFLFIFSIVLTLGISLVHKRARRAKERKSIHQKQHHQNGQWTMAEFAADNIDREARGYGPDMAASTQLAEAEDTGVMGEVQADSCQIFEAPGDLAALPELSDTSRGERVTYKG